jgi:hypothetical protein
MGPGSGTHDLAPHLDGTDDLGTDDLGTVLGTVLAELPSGGRMAVVTHDLGAGPLRGRRRTAGATAVCIAAAGYGWWAVGLPPFSAAAAAAVVVAGIAAVIVGATLRPGRAGASRGAAAPAGPRREGDRSAMPWAVLAALAAAWQLAAYLQHPRDDHPTISSVANAAFGTQAARTAAFVAWLAAAVALARRGAATMRQR